MIVYDSICQTVWWFVSGSYLACCEAWIQQTWIQQPWIQQPYIFNPHFQQHSLSTTLRFNNTQIQQKNFNNTHLQQSLDSTQVTRVRIPIRTEGGAEHPRSEGRSFPCLFCGTQVTKVAPPPPPKVVRKSPDCRTFQQFRRIGRGGVVSPLLGNCLNILSEFLFF